MNINKQDRNLIVGIAAVAAFVYFMRSGSSECYSCNKH